MPSNVNLDGKVKKRLALGIIITIVVISVSYLYFTTIFQRKTVTIQKINHEQNLVYVSEKVDQPITSSDTNYYFSYSSINDFSVGDIVEITLKKEAVGTTFPAKINVIHMRKYNH
ncbi:MAG: hypothetical protein ACTIJA_04600 [Bavariicoccus seileri]|uniref:Uncharacterized protein n=1 Tax=Bavariicoccus seileri TaxID=549685 RepID=A0A3D4S613_9ENTE|nr:hypothetical protein [Bavariicoccus seileri]HCS93912.1 hypothetical protein [Bavariicoccus seileri]